MNPKEYVIGWGVKPSFVMKVPGHAYDIANLNGVEVNRHGEHKEEVDAIAFQLSLQRKGLGLNDNPNRDFEIAEDIYRHILVLDKAGFSINGHSDNNIDSKDEVRNEYTYVPEGIILPSNRTTRHFHPYEEVVVFLGSLTPGLKGDPRFVSAEVVDIRDQDIVFGAKENWHCEDENGFGIAELHSHEILLKEEFMFLINNPEYLESWMSTVLGSNHDNNEFRFYMKVCSWAVKLTS